LVTGNSACVRERRWGLWSVAVALAVLVTAVGVETSTAAKDRGAPTMPSSVTVTAVTSSSISLTWDPSSDDKRLGGYLVYVDGAMAGKTLQTSYVVAGLACGHAYTLGVAAIDRAGNRSSTASVISSTEACRDTTPPSAPTDLEAFPASDTSVSLRWSPATDDVGVTDYGVYREGVLIGTTADTTATVDKLECGTTHALGVDAVDAAGNRSPVASLQAATLECPGAPSPSPSPFAIRGVYDRDLSSTGFDDEAALGLNVIDSGPYTELLDPLAARGLKAMIWLGGYDNSTCSFVKSDEWVRTHVSEIAGHPAVAAYFVDDEPNAASCPNAPTQMKARSDLVKSIDPSAITFLVDYKIDQLALWAGTVDVIGLDKYPCKLKIDGCDFTGVDQLIAEADRLGIRYWGVIQAFGDDYYKLPTAEELHTQFDRWRNTNMEGYLVFAWRYPDDHPENWLANHPELQAQLATENGLS
jgi:chitodextrinase